MNNHTLDDLLVPFTVLGFGGHRNRDVKSQLANWIRSQNEEISVDIIGDLITGGAFEAFKFYVMHGGKWTKNVRNRAIESSKNPERPEFYQYLSLRNIPNSSHSYSDFAIRLLRWAEAFNLYRVSSVCPPESILINEIKMKLKHTKYDAHRVGVLQNDKLVLHWLILHKPLSSYNDHIYNAILNNCRESAIYLIRKSGKVENKDQIISLCKEKHMEDLIPLLKY